MKTKKRKYDHNELVERFMRVHNIYFANKIKSNSTIVSSTWKVDFDL